MTGHSFLESHSQLLEFWVLSALYCRVLVIIKYCLYAQSMGEEIRGSMINDIEAVENPTSITPAATAIWTPLPRQPKQMRCRQFLAHGDERRTFYWIMENTGPICQQCVNVRNTKAALAEQEAGKSGNQEKLGKSGKLRHSTKAPAYVGRVLAKRALGENYSQIARETHSSRNTVKQIIAESDFDQQFAEGRRSCMGLIPKAVAAMDTQLSKGDGTLGRQFLNDVGVIGERFVQSKPHDVAVAMQNIHNQIQIYLGKVGDPLAQTKTDVIDVKEQVSENHDIK
jgi:hypothetical protein